MEKMSFDDCLSFECGHLRQGSLLAGGDDICGHNSCPVWDVSPKDCPNMQELEETDEDDIRESDSFELAMFEADFGLFVDLFEASVSASSPEEGVRRVNELVKERCRM